MSRQLRRRLLDREHLTRMGVHTGDSVTVAPALTLTDKEYQQDARCRPPHHQACGYRDGRVEHPVRGQPRRLVGWSPSR